MATATTTIKVPPAFYDARVASGLPAGTETHRTLKVVTVEADAATVLDLRASAQQYADNAELYWKTDRGLVISARATLRALEGIEVATDPEPASPIPEPESEGDAPRRRNLRPVAAGTTLANGQLAPGALAQAVADHVTAHPDVDHSVGEVAKALGGKSAGAVRNALDRMLTDGRAALTVEKPRRYQASAA